MGNTTFGNAESAREAPLLEGSQDGAPQKVAPPDDRTGFRTSLTAHAARVVFLFSHGIFLVMVSLSLADLDEASWDTLFVPILVGNLLCILLLIWSVFASCPYIKRSQKLARIRVGNYPSILTELLPEIFLSIIGVFLMLLICAG